MTVVGAALTVTSEAAAIRLEYRDQNDSIKADRLGDTLIWSA